MPLYRAGEEVENGHPPRPTAYPMSSAEQARWFSEHVQPHEPALRAYLSMRFPSLPDHDDLVQETYARLLRVPSSASRAPGVFQCARCSESLQESDGHGPKPATARSDRSLAETCNT